MQLRTILAKQRINQAALALLKFFVEQRPLIRAIFDSESHRAPVFRYVCSFVRSHKLGAAAILNLLFFDGMQQVLQSGLAINQNSEIAYDGWITRQWFVLRRKVV